MTLGREPLLAVIGGSGLNRMDELVVESSVAVETPFGAPSAALILGRYHGRPVLFLPRHGSGHTIPPHAINYRANLWALRERGAKLVLGVAAVGAIPAAMAPATIAVPDQVLDYTWGRAHTIYDGADGVVDHVDFTAPYCPRLRNDILAAAVRAGIEVVERCTYAATQGPRLESAAEIDRLERDGAHVVGMTGMPEAALARELGLCYASLAVVANAAAGRGSGPITMDEVHAHLETGMARVRVLLAALLEVLAGRSADAPQ